MPRLLTVRQMTRVALVLAGGALAAPAATEPAIHFVEQDRIVLEIRPLTARTVEETGRGFRLEIGETAPADLELRLLWPDPAVPSRLKLRATWRPASAGHRVRLDSELLRSDGTVAQRARREILFTTDTATALFEVARFADRPLTLAITGALTRDKVYSARPTVGPAVQFQLDIEWVEAGEAVVLETNLLHTFVGQSVSYEFQLGETGQAESASVRLLPLRLLADAVRVEVDVTGTLPDAERGLVMVSRQEQWLSSNGTTTALSLASGEPPTGFRFLVTPRF